MHERFPRALTLPKKLLHINAGHVHRFLGKPVPCALSSKEQRRLTLHVRKIGVLWQADGSSQKDDA